MLGRVLDEGPAAGQPGAARAPTYLPPGVEELDHLMVTLPADMRLILELDQDRRESFKTMAVRLNCSPGECSKLRGPMRSLPAA